MRTRSEFAWGGGALAIAGLLLSGSQLLMALMPAPPGTLSGLVEWVGEHRTSIAWTSELLMLAGLGLVPASILLYRAISKAPHPFSALAGCGALLFAAAVAIFPLMMAGRLVYPLFGLGLTPEVMALVVSGLYAGMHAIAVVLAFALGAIGLAMRGTGVPAWLPSVGHGAALAQVVAAFPWLVPTWVCVAAATALLAWTVAAGTWWAGCAAPTGAPDQSS